MSTSAECDHWNLHCRGLELGLAFRRAIPGIPVALYHCRCFYQRACLDCEQLGPWLTSVQIIFCATLLKMPLYSNISGRTAVYWLSQVGVRTHTPDSLLSLANKAVRCRSSDFELDQRDLFRRHGEAVAADRLCQRLRLCGAGSGAYPRALATLNPMLTEQGPQLRLEDNRFPRSQEGLHVGCCPAGLIG